MKSIGGVDSAQKGHSVEVIFWRHQPDSHLTIYHSRNICYEYEDIGQVVGFNRQIPIEIILWRHQPGPHLSINKSGILTNK